MLTEAQEAELVQGGDCRLHWHSEDRTVDHYTLLALQGASNVVTKSANYTVSDNDDFILVDQTCTITLPRAGNTRREVEVVLIAASKTLTIVPTGTDTVQGTTSVIETSQWSALRFKAVTGGWVLI